MLDLWKQTLTQEFLEEPEVNNLDFLILLGITLGKQPILLKNLYKAYLKEESNFGYKPMIGAALDISFDQSEQQVSFSRAQESVKLTFGQFQKYIGLIDLLFTDIYPIGTVAELDETLLPPYIQEMYGDSEEGFLVSIHGRRVLTKQEDEYIDYIATIWPFGLLDDVELIYLNNVMIKRVVSLGMVNDTEKIFVEEVLRKQLLMKDVYSYLYTDSAMTMNWEVEMNES
ncbi:DUF4176 domain-containing protein [Enterococcus sp. AZ196]|uniref:DUF4176 domain-containing protein n=1 Tax=Enterococcus sp. AZ196 TaxID=2774659 RepID=UPI003D2C4E9A